MTADAGDVALEIEGLRTFIDGPHGKSYPVNDVSLRCRPGRTLALVGESGSGKSMTFLSVLGLLPKGGRIESGTIRFRGADVTDEAARRRLRGASVAMIFQDALAGLNPAFTVGSQIGHVMRHHQKLSRRAAREGAVEALRLVGIPNPAERAGYYPHQLSGGMRQRVMIAMGIALRPRVLIADEPTTALDVTIQAQIMELLDRLREQLGMSLVIITHDLGVVARYAADVAVMYAGRIVEQGTVDEVLTQPVHPYSAALQRSTPRHDAAAADLSPIPGQPPNLLALPAGCAFQPRCDVAAGRERCSAERPALRAVYPGAVNPAGQLAACHFPLAPAPAGQALATAHGKE